MGVDELQEDGTTVKYFIEYQSRDGLSSREAWPGSGEPSHFIIRLMDVYFAGLQGRVAKDEEVLSGNTRTYGRIYGYEYSHTENDVKEQTYVYREMK